MKRTENKILNKCKKASIPKNLVPMAMTILEQPFDHEDWQFEIKWDGFRMLTYCQGKKVDIRSRGNNSFDKRFKVLKEELEKYELNAIFDGEVVMLDENGKADFHKLMFSPDSGTLAYYIFDILWLDGHDLTDLPLVERRHLLKTSLPPSDIIRYSDHVDRSGTELFKLATQHRIEGIVAKHKDSKYFPGSRSTKWLKIKTGVLIEAVVAGYLIDKDKVGTGFSSLIIGRNTKKGFKYIGNVGLGVGQATLNKVLHARLAKKCIFSPLPNVNRRTAFTVPIKNCKIIWLDPELACKVKYLELDKFGIMRHASFKGLIE